MDREQLHSCLCGGILAFCLSFGSTACMVTGLRLDASLTALALGGVFCAATAAGFLYANHGGWYLLGSLVLFGCFWVFYEEFLNQAAHMAAQILSYYNRAYGIVIPDALVELKEAPHLQPLLLIGWVTAGLCCRTVCRAKGVTATLVAAILPLVACLVVTDTVLRGRAAVWK